MSGSRPMAWLPTAALAAAVLVGLALMPPARALLQAYLTGYLFFVGPVLGGLGMLLLRAASGAFWGDTLAPGFHSLVRLLPLAALLSLPLLLNPGQLYPWAAPSGGGAAERHWYLNQPFFLARQVFYFAAWLGLGALLRSRRALLDRLALPGLVLFGFTASFAAIDWIMSLDPDWYSSVFGLLVLVGQLLAATAVAVILQRPAGAAGRAAGSALITLVLSWAYLAFMQYLTIWSADLPDEITWYLSRLHTSWRWLGLALVLAQFIVPFCLLLPARHRASPRTLRGLAWLLVAAHGLLVIWLVVPGQRPEGIALHATDLAILPLVAALWLGLHFQGGRDRDTVAGGVTAHET